MKNPLIITGVVLAIILLGVGSFAYYQYYFGFRDGLIIMEENDLMMPNDETSIDTTSEKLGGEERLMLKERLEESMVTETKKNESVMMQSASSRFVTFGESTLEEASTDRRVLFFYASWCPTCKQAEESFNQNVTKIPEDVTLIRVNYNDTETDKAEKDLARKYGITYQHTFVQIDASGNEITKWNGGDIDKLLSNIQ